MKVCVHRGTHEIGGSCVEIEASGARLVLDIGWPLNADRDAVLPLPPVSGMLTGDDPSLLGVIVSHPHMDHWGFLPQVHREVPVYMGEAAHRILREAKFFSPAGIDIAPRGFLRDRENFPLGPFRVTPYLADHSAFDAYSLLVEADGQRLFYTGDLRAHGRKGVLFERLLLNPPTGIDVLLLEGTHVRPPDEAGSPIVSEQDIERQMVQSFRSTSGMAIVAFSAQNIDRLVTVYRASLQADRDLLVDLYTATLARATGNPNIPQPGFDRLRVFVPQSQRVQVKETGQFSRVDEIKPWRVYPEDLAERRARSVMIFRASMIGDLERANCLEGAGLIWSLWHGYLNDGSWSAKAIHEFLARHGIPMVEHHSSGHASVEDLRRLVDALNPGRVVPIHTAAPDMYANLFPRVAPVQDGAWWEV